MNLPRFSKKNTSFQCENCKKQVEPASKTCRDHCPFCLYSKHVDVNPGDRQNPCQGLMKPIGYEKHKKSGWSILYQCTRCDERHKNVGNFEDDIQPDDFDLLIKLNKNT